VPATYHPDRDKPGATEDSTEITGPPISALEFFVGELRKLLVNRQVGREAQARLPEETKRFQEQLPPRMSRPPNAP